MHDNDYENKIGGYNELFERDYIERLEYARENGVNTVILTGTGEALQNKNFLNKFAEWNKNLYRPFHVIELQTTGVFLTDDNLNWLRKDIGVKTISLSVVDLFDDENNMNIIGVSTKLKFNLKDLCDKIKEKGFNLRISLNMIKPVKYQFINHLKLKPIFVGAATYTYFINSVLGRAKELNADQITFRKMWNSDSNTEQDKWVEKNAITDDLFFNLLSDTIRKKGKLIGKLPFGAEQYSVDGVSVVTDIDCMAKDIKEELKYIILRENGKIYFLWDCPASLIF